MENDIAKSTKRTVVTNKVAFAYRSYVTKFAATQLIEEQINADELVPKEARSTVGEVLMGVRNELRTELKALVKKIITEHIGENCIIIKE